MDYTINLNQDLNGIEIIFASKPATAILEALKKQGFKWNNKKSLWYAKQTDNRLTFANSLGQTETTETPASNKPVKISFDKEMITEEYKKAWSYDSHMTNYCVNKLANIAILPDGGIISIDKQSIETRFCFGESGYDFEDAQKMAYHAQTSEEYFKKENMASFNEYIKDLEEALTENPRYYLIIRDIHYTGQPENCRLRGTEWKRLCDVLDACGGSAYLSELPGKHLEALKGHIASKQELEIILEAYKQARDAHEKKVNAYLKRYGLSKVDSWTYWREA